MAIMALTDGKSVFKLAQIDGNLGCEFYANQKSEVTLTIERVDGLCFFNRFWFFKRNVWDNFLWSEEAGQIDFNKLIRSQTKWKRILSEGYQDQC